MENILDTHLLLQVGYSDCLEDSLMLYNIKPGVNIGYIYTASQVFQGYGPRLSCWEDTQREQLDHRATDVVVRDALPESSTSPLCGFRGLKGLHRKVREHWPKKKTQPFNPQSSENVQLHQPHVDPWSVQSTGEPNGETPRRPPLTAQCKVFT